MWSTEAAGTRLAGKQRVAPFLPRGLRMSRVTSGNTTNMMTGRRDPVEVAEEGEGEEEELAGVTTRSGAGLAPDRSASGTRGSAASGEAE